MKPFKMFFGFSVAMILFMFMARVFFVAFVAAAIMSLIYAVFRRIKDFVIYDSYGNPYMSRPRRQRAMNRAWSRGIEPLFYEDTYHTQRSGTINKVQFIKAI